MATITAMTSTTILIVVGVTVIHVGPAQMDFVVMKILASYLAFLGLAIYRSITRNKRATAVVAVGTQVYCVSIVSYSEDCDIEGIPVVGCPDGEYCGKDGYCFTWICSSGYNTGDGCDCECGGWDQASGCTGFHQRPVLPR